MPLPAGPKLYLHDKLLHQYILLNPGTEYRFSITKDSATQGNQRFELGMDPASVQAVAAKDFSTTIVAHPATDEVNINIQQDTKEKVSVRVTDLSGVAVYSKDMGTLQNSTVAVPVNSLASGIYLVQVTSGNRTVTQKLFKE